MAELSGALPSEVTDTWEYIMPQLSNSIKMDKNKFFIGGDFYLKAEIYEKRKD